MIRRLVAVAPVFLFVLCSCATSPKPRATLTYDDCAAMTADYAAARPRETAELKQADLVADVTVVELDDSLLPRFLAAISSDVAGRCPEPVGETLALLALSSGGDVRLRPSVPVRLDEPIALASLEECIYVADWDLKGGRRTPVLQSVSTGVSLTLRVRNGASGAFEVHADADCSDRVEPLHRIAIEPDLFIQVPEIIRQESATTSSLMAGETLVFSLQRRGHRTTLLCLRLERRT